MDAASPRYAVYYTPDPMGPLWRFGSSVIGYDAYAAREVASSIAPGFDAATWSDRTDEPRRYGFHATLRAPFYLSPGRDEAELGAAVAALAAHLTPPPPVALEVATLGSFVALLISGDDRAVRALAAAVVIEMEPFRAPLLASDRQRRLKANLSPRQIDYLGEFGYPYVLEEFRFHMTLTGKLASDELIIASTSLARAFAEAVPSRVTTIDHLALLRQDGRDARFKILKRYPLRGNTARQAPATP